MHYVTYRNNKFAANQNTRMVIRGYNADINILNSEFTDNRCQRQSLIGLLGMEKRVSLSGNTITNNVNCTALVDFDIVSQTEFSPPVPASVTRNVIRGNACPPSSDPDGVLDSSTPTCAAVSVQGIQDVLVQRNIISNGYQTELIAGVQSSSLINSFNCTENYWGSVDIEVIRSRIFDYDSWNNFAVADFSRYLTTESLDSPVSSAVIPPRTIDFNRPFGGRIARDTRLQWRRTPYLVNRDITVMPGATLSIDAGVELQFYPNVGMLVLGRIDAMGSYNSPIKMRPVVKAAAAAAGRKRRKRRDTTTSSTAEYFAKYTEPESSKGGVKVSLERNGIRLVAGRIANEGFLQFYNTSAARWDIVCDNQFSEEVGRVVCRELGVETFNVIVRETYLYDHYVYGFDNQFVRKYFWMRTYNCKGTELSRAECTERLNYDSLMCGRRRGYVFLRCGQSNLQPGETYWGSIRVAHPAIEQSNPITGKPSQFRYVNIYGAGVLHKQKVAAIQTTYQYPLFDTVTISNCASDGYKIIAPRQFVRVANTTVRDNLGTGYSIIVLNGDSANPETTPLVSFNPLVESSIPYNLVGLVDICDRRKDMVVVDRLLVFYKYSYETRACTKLFRSQVSAKRVALRFLQIQLYYDPFSKNSIELFNGDRFNTTELLAYISAANMTSSDDRRRTFRTRPAYDTMGVHIHASSAAPTNGFIAEVVTLPLSPDKTYPDLNNFMEHYVRQSVFTGNQEGGVHYRGVGEINPDFVAHFNQFERNGLDILNLTSRPVLFAQMQNGRYLDVSNNLVLNNFGGLQFDMWSTGLSKSAKSNITNNAIIRNTHGGALWISGNHYNMFKVTNNFFESNVAEMRDLVSIQGVLMKPFARNYFHRNVAGYIMNASGYEDLSTKSEFSWNGFYQNQALNWTRRSTIFLGSTKHQFRHNYFRNLANNFEIATGNMSIIRTADIDTNGNCLAEAWFCKEGWVKRLEFNKCICYRRDTVDARYNWWGEPYSFYAPGRLWDNSDDPYIIGIDYSNYYTDNSSVLESPQCPPTSNVSAGNCYWWFGAPLTYDRAKLFCQNEIGGVMGDSRDSVSFMTALMASSQNNYDWINRYAWTTRGWVYSEQPFPAACPVVRNNWLEGFPCDTATSFFCQVSPSGTLRTMETAVLASISSILALFLLLALVLLILWAYKSRQRQKARMVRRENYRASTKSSRSAAGAFGTAVTQHEYLSGGSRSNTGLGFYTLQSGLPMSDYRPPADAQSVVTGLTAGGLGPAGRRESDRGIRLADTVDTLDRAKVEELQSASSATSSDGSSSVYRPSLAGPATTLSGSRRFMIENQIPEADTPQLSGAAAAAPARIRMGTGGAGAGPPDHMRRNKLTLSRPATNPMQTRHPQAAPPNVTEPQPPAQPPRQRGHFDSEFEDDDDDDDQEGKTSSDELTPTTGQQPQPQSRPAYLHQPRRSLGRTADDVRRFASAGESDI
ncbi:hypothetical protein BOX15_Mlig027693g2 [Macrostomum lignano]|uniref:SRCR domain-containing protein n=1 Tax=Macrostomum lignano TaxID=282301 RepID=A0A267DE02_9PLAT|nr:hypothetical protein BOX15_Mlig027693g2 [Macrostomum lignano]